jgi:hypothetical protein
VVFKYEYGENQPTRTMVEYHPGAVNARWARRVLGDAVKLILGRHEASVAIAAIGPGCRWESGGIPAENHGVRNDSPADWD